MTGSETPDGGVDHHVVDVAHLFAVFLAQPDDDGVLVPALAELRRGGARDVRPDRVGHLRGVEAEERGLGAINLHRQLGACFVAAEPRIGDARRVLHQVLYVLGDPPCGLEIFAANLNRHAPAAAADPTRHQLVDLVVAAGRVGAHDDARKSRQLPPEIERNLIARALA